MGDKFRVRRMLFSAPILTEVLAPFPKDFVIVNSFDDPTILELILRRPEFPQGTEVITSELSGVPYDKICKGKTETEQKRALVKFAEEGDISRFTKIAAGKNLSLWLGIPVVETDCYDSITGLYNAYAVFENGVMRFFHLKRHLFKTEKDIFDTPEEYDGHRRGRTILICHEVQGFYDPVWKECRLPEARDGKSRLVIIPAVWTANKQDVLKRIVRSIVRKIKEPIDAESALHPDGSIALVADSNWAGLFGATEQGRQKAASFTQIQGAGWIHIRRADKIIETVEETRSGRA